MAQHSMSFTDVATEAKSRGLGAWDKRTSDSFTATSKCLKPGILEFEMPEKVASRVMGTHGEVAKLICEQTGANIRSQTGADTEGNH